METARIRRPAVIAASGAAVTLYFGLSVLFFPAYFHATVAPRHPAPEVSSVVLSPSPGQAAAVGRPISISVVATNNGDDADLQTVSVAFPNITSAGQITIANQDFLQKPILISRGSTVGAGYTAGDQVVTAQYAAIEAQSWPWDHGKSYRMDLLVSPQAPGTFVVLVKSVAIPHNGSEAHYPQGGLLDQQREYAEPYIITVKNS